jgi:glycosyltransferase involved in cell wall biosynthesis
VVVFTSEPVSGAARYVREFVAALTAGGASVTLFCPENFAYRREAVSAGVRVVLASSRSNRPAGTLHRIARNLRHLFGAALSQAMATKPKDIVHFQFPVPLAGVGFLWLARLRKCRIVLTAHDPMPHKWLLPRKLMPFERNIVRWSYCLSDRIIVHNESGRDVLVNEFRQHPDKVVTISHGPLCLAEEISPAPDGELRLLVFGGIRENKGVHLAIRAAQSLNAGPEPFVRLTIAGAAANAREQSYWENCRRLIDEKPSGIRVIDRYIEDDEIGGLISEHHALLLPYSDFKSESGVAALALSNRRAIIASAAGGLGELLQQVRCGIPIRDCTPEGVADAIVRARHAGPRELQTMGEAGAALMESGRSWKEIAEKTLAVYGSI